MPRRTRRDPRSVDLEALEKEAERRAAWGHFTVYMNHQQFAQTLAGHDQQIAQARNPEAKGKAEEEKEAFLKKRRGGGFWVG